MKTGLILEGGAMRGMFTCGVTDVFQEKGIRFDGAAGISAGAVFGCNYKSRQPGRAIRYNKKYSRDWRYCSLRSLILTGDLYGADFCYRLLPEELDPFDSETFRQDPMEFFAGATDIQTGEAVFRPCRNGDSEDLRWLLASASMPLVSRPVEIGGRLYLDGGIVTSVPYAYMESQGYDRNVAILTQPRGYEKKKCSPLLPLLTRKYPRVARALKERHENYNREMREIEARERDGRLLVIRPPEDLRIHRTERDPGELERVYQIGRAEGLRRVEEVRRYLVKTD